MVETTPDESEFQMPKVGGDLDNINVDEALGINEPDANAEEQTAEALLPNINYDLPRGERKLRTRKRKIAHASRMANVRNKRKASNRNRKGKMKR
jgi:hypothetical protein